MIQKDVWDMYESFFFFFFMFQITLRKIKKKYLMCYDEINGSKMMGPNRCTDILLYTFIEQNSDLHSFS